MRQANADLGAECQVHAGNSYLVRCAHYDEAMLTEMTGLPVHHPDPGRFTLITLQTAPEEFGEGHFVYTASPLREAVWEGMRKLMVDLPLCFVMPHCPCIDDPSIPLAERAHGPPPGQRSVWSTQVDHLFVSPGDGDLVTLW